MKDADPYSAEIRPDDFAFVYLDVDFPPVAWLVYRGLLISSDCKSANPGNISWFFVDVVRRGLISTIRREGILEGFRLKEFEDRPSRLSCVYAYPTLETATRGDYGRGKFRKENLVAIAPDSTQFKTSAHDSNWITDFDSLPYEVGKKYWTGEQTKEPLLEFLLTGRFWIFGTTVRTRAYETIKQTWPNSLAILELSRLATYFDSDLGAVAPWLKREKDERIVVSQVIKYDDAEGVEILRRAIEQRKRNPSFWINWTDLEPLRHPAPDPEWDTRFCVPDARPYEHELRLDKIVELQSFVNSILRPNQSQRR